jgi:hypothetical protein
MADEAAHPWTAAKFVLARAGNPDDANVLAWCKAQRVCPFTHVYVAGSVPFLPKNLLTFAFSPR